MVQIKSISIILLFDVISYKKYIPTYAHRVGSNSVELSGTGWELGGIWVELGGSGRNWVKLGGTGRNREELGGTERNWMATGRKPGESGRNWVNRGGTG